MGKAFKLEFEINFKAACELLRQTSYSRSHNDCCDINKMIFSKLNDINIFLDLLGEDLSIEKVKDLLTSGGFFFRDGQYRNDDNNKLASLQFIYDTVYHRGMNTSCTVKYLKDMKDFINSEKAVYVAKIFNQLEPPVKLSRVGYLLSHGGYGNIIESDELFSKGIEKIYRDTQFLIDSPIFNKNDVIESIVYNLIIFNYINSYIYENNTIITDKIIEIEKYFIEYCKNGHNRAINYTKALSCLYNVEFLQNNEFFTDAVNSLNKRYANDKNYQVFLKAVNRSFVDLTV